VPERIIELARSEAFSLIVIGRRGLKGIRALGSVSERVAHRAPCSVLIVPPGDARSA
jgi:nucleotide-binding universal stress UspA family protein